MCIRDRVKEFQLNELATHLFILYYSMLAAFTPPVAAAAFVAAAIAKAPPMSVAWRAARLGVVIYIVPFFFLFQPALIFEGPVLKTLYLFVFTVVGIVFIAGGVEGYLWKLGVPRFWARLSLILGGFLIALPEEKTTIIGAVLVLITIAIMLITKKRKANLSPL